MLRLAVVSVTLCLALAASPAEASFHLMQIEQVIGGVSGNTAYQAIQLRMRSFGQNFVSEARIRAWDASGANPIVIVDMETDVANNTAGSRVLIVSPQYDSAFGPDEDFVMTNLIPASYLAAGKLTFETDGGLVYWSLAWGGASYTGGNFGTFDNDADGNFSPPFAGPLPSSSLQALQFTGIASAPSTNNAANYALTAGTAVLINNDNETGSPSLVATATPTLTPSSTPTRTNTPTPSVTPTPSTTPTITPSLTPGGVILDIDDDGTTQALTDGLLALRYVFGFRDAALINGALGTGAGRDSADEIEAFMQTILGSLDVDGNGAVEPLSDGLLVLRYLFGFRDAALITGAIGTGATRTTADEIETYIATLL
jgi:hypothetical protein